MNNLCYRLWHIRSCRLTLDKCDVTFWKKMCCTVLRTEHFHCCYFGVFKPGVKGETDGEPECTAYTCSSHLSTTQQPWPKGFYPFTVFFNLLRTRIYQTCTVLATDTIKEIRRAKGNFSIDYRSSFWYKRSRPLLVIRRNACLKPHTVSFIWSWFLFFFFSFFCIIWQILWLCSYLFQTHHLRSPKTSWIYIYTSRSKNPKCQIHIHFLYNAMHTLPKICLPYWTWYNNLLLRKHMYALTGWQQMFPVVLQICQQTLLSALLAKQI